MKNNLKKEYRDLEMKIMASLRDAINNSNYTSNHVQQKAIKVNVFDYVEMAIIITNCLSLDLIGRERACVLLINYDKPSKMTSSYT